jgi:hypothetical protein
MIDWVVLASIIDWDTTVLLYLLVLLTVYPVSSERLKWIDFCIVLGAGALLVTGFLRTIA